MVRTYVIALLFLSILFCKQTLFLFQGPKLDIDINLLMSYFETSKIREFSSPAVKKQKWIEITEKYNNKKGTTFSKSQLDNKLKSYKRSLSTKQSKLKTSHKKTGIHIISLYS